MQEQADSKGALLKKISGKRLGDRQIPFKNSTSESTPR